MYASHFFCKKFGQSVVKPNTQLRFLKIMYPWLRICVLVCNTKTQDGKSQLNQRYMLHISSTSLLLKYSLFGLMCYYVYFKHRIEVALILFLPKKMLLKSSFLQSDPLLLYLTLTASCMGIFLKMIHSVREVHFLASIA